jgi:hypothetical protein
MTLKKQGDAELFSLATFKIRESEPVAEPVPQIPEPAKRG